MTDYTVKRIDDMEAVFRGGFRKARAELGISAFGMQVIDFPANLRNYPDHDHTHDGQEEVYLLLDGAADLDIEGDRVALDRSTMVRVGPEARRHLVTEHEPARVLVIGAVPGKPYEIVQ